MADWNTFVEKVDSNCCMKEFMYVQSCIRKGGETVEMTNETLIGITGSFPDIQ